MADFMGIPLAGLTSPMLVSFFVLAVLSGLIVPRRVLKDAQDDRDNWKKAYENQVEITHAQSEQITNLSEGAKLSQKVVEAMGRAAAAAGFQVMDQGLVLGYKEREENVRDLGGEGHEG